MWSFFITPSLPPLLPPKKKKKIPISKTKKLETERNEFNIYPAPKDLCTIEVWFKEERSEGKIQNPLTIPVLSFKSTNLKKQNKISKVSHKWQEAALPKSLQRPCSTRGRDLQLSVLRWASARQTIMAPREPLKPAMSMSSPTRGDLELWIRPLNPCPPLKIP